MLKEGLTVELYRISGWSDIRPFLYLRTFLICIKKGLFVGFVENYFLFFFTIFNIFLAGYPAGYPVIRLDIRLSGYPAGYPVHSKIIGRILGQFSIRYNPIFKTHK